MTAKRNRISKAEQLERDRKAVELRLSGVDLTTIAERLNYSDPGHAHQRIMALLKENAQAPSDDLRKVEAERLDALMQSRWQKALDGDDYAMDRVLKLMHRRAALLGLDTPADNPLANLSEINVKVVYDYGTPPDALDEDGDD